uniref:Uncharacterized protein n=1 Tax=Opuntia streptacantha TaxID=393608 RepID=A0A7C9DPX0_OPUST
MKWMILLQTQSMAFQETISLFVLECKYQLTPSRTTSSAKSLSPCTACWTIWFVHRLLHSLPRSLSVALPPWILDSRLWMPLQFQAKRPVKWVIGANCAGRVRL